MSVALVALSEPFKLGKHRPGAFDGITAILVLNGGHPAEVLVEEVVSRAILDRVPNAERFYRVDFTVLDLIPPGPDDRSPPEGVGDGD